jgi:hypothetical protein
LPIAERAERKGRDRGLVPGLDGGREGTAQLVDPSADSRALVRKERRGTHAGSQPLHRDAADVE